MRSEATRPVRFDPPPVEIPDALRWVLTRALGPGSAPAPRPDDGVRALELARESALAALIGSRHSLEALAAEVGARAAAGFRLECESARRGAETLLGVLPAVAEAARGVGTPVVLLKFAALTIAGHASAGERNAGDVDVLVGAEAAEEMAASLLAHGFENTGFRESAHQLPTLRNRAGAKLELHRHIPGVRVPGEDAPATVASLDAAGLLETVSLSLPTGEAEHTVPARELLVAHTVVHGVAQHGFGGYPLFRMVADLVALGSSTMALARVHRWISTDVCEDETRAALTLAKRLEDGDAAVFDLSGSSPDVVLLRHLVATLLDAEYVNSLRLRQPISRLALRKPVSLAGAAWRAVALTDAQIDIVYGPPRSRWGYLGWRLARPFDLARRALRYGVSALRVRFRR